MAASFLNINIFLILFWPVSLTLATEGILGTDFYIDHVLGSEEPCSGVCEPPNHLKRFCGIQCPGYVARTTSTSPPSTTTTTSTSPPSTTTTTSTSPPSTTTTTFTSPPSTTPTTTPHTELPATKPEQDGTSESFLIYGPVLIAIVGFLIIFCLAGVIYIGAKHLPESSCLKKICKSENKPILPTQAQGASSEGIQLLRDGRERVINTITTEV